MRDYVSVLTIVIMTCIGLAVIIPMLCLCACLTRFCYVACQQKEPEKKKCSRRRYQVENREPKSGTSQHPVTDSTTVVNVSRNERQITKGQDSYSPRIRTEIITSHQIEHLEGRITRVPPHQCRNKQKYVTDITVNATVAFSNIKLRPEKTNKTSN
ncbi:hypothetical protein ACH3XW_42705 [Acanthocheilonema viteae]